MENPTENDALLLNRQKREENSDCLANALSTSHTRSSFKLLRFSICLDGNYLVPSLARLFVNPKQWVGLLSFFTRRLRSLNAQKSLLWPILSACAIPVVLYYCPSTSPQRFYFNFKKMLMSAVIFQWCSLLTHL